MIADTRGKLPGVLIVIMGLWNKHGPLGEPHASPNTAFANMAAPLGLPFVEWPSDLKEGGYVGHPSSRGNSGIYTGDGAHRTISGHAYTKASLMPCLQAVWDGLVA
jgi:hypothetical protein